jgi:hypothetical protein
MSRAGHLNKNVGIFLGTLALAAAIAACASGSKPHADIVKSPASKPLPEQLFASWPQKTPDVALILTGEQHGYFKFCGCSDPQLGGFERRYNFMAKLKEKGWPLVAVDLGDMAYRRSGSVQEQNLLKYAASMKALDVLGCVAIGLGEHEFNLPLLEGLTRYTLQNPDANPRVLAANLNAEQRAQMFPLDGVRSMIGETVIVPVGNNGPKVGVVTVVAPSVRERIHDKTLKFDNNQTVLQAALKTFDANQVNLRVLLYQGTMAEATDAVKMFPQFDVVLCKSPQEEPPGAPTMVGNSMIVEIGHKARYVGVVGAFKTGKDKPAFDLHYQLVALNPDLESDADKVQDHKIVQIFEEYAKQVRDARLLSRYPKTQHPYQTKFPGKKAAFVGSEACKACHQAEYDVWAKSGHGHAYQTLVDHPKATKPSLRQFDGECIVCHVVGFNYEHGYIDEARTPHLKNVGCENCHGPGGLHVANPTDPTFYRPLSPWKLQPTDRVGGPEKYNEEVLKRVDQICQSCHDGDNDPKFRFEQYWPKIEHGKKSVAANNDKK